MFRASRSQGEATERPVCVGYFGPVGRTVAWTGARRGSGPACGPPGGTDSRRGDPMRRRGRLLDQVAAAMRPPVHRAGGGLGLESSRVVAAIACFVLWDGDMVHVGRGVAKAFG